MIYRAWVKFWLIVMTLAGAMIKLEPVDPKVYRHGDHSHVLVTFHKRLSVAAPPTEEHMDVHG